MARKTGSKRGHGEGSIYQRERDGRWVAQVTLPGGKRKYYTGKTRKEAAEKLSTALVDMRQGLPLPDGRRTLNQLLDSWLGIVKSRVRPSTSTSYEQKVRLHIQPELGTLRLDQLTPDTIQGFLDGKHAAGLSPRSVQYLRAVLRMALRQAVKWRWIGYNAAQFADPPEKDRHKPAVLNPDQAQALMASLAGSRLDALVAVIIGTGLRRGEALGLHWRDIALDGGQPTLTVRGQYQRQGGMWTWVEPKTETSVRTLELPGFAVEALRAHRTRQLAERLAAGPAWQDMDLVFPAPDGTPWDANSVTHQFAKCVARLAKEWEKVGRTFPLVTLHGLRHSTATMLLANGRTLGEVQKVLGHSQVALTADLYTQLVPEIARQAAQTMDRLFTNAAG